MTLTAAPVSASPPRPTKLRQMPGLDGLRGIAVAAVIIFHLQASALPGGYLGVDVFFVISGYLITSLLLSEQHTSSRISLVPFWTRRALRLLPALVVLLLAVTLIAACFARDSLGGLRSDLPASLFYVMNWRMVFGHQSYMASFGRPPLLQHLWSLSVEEQFYLLWPPVLIMLRRLLPRASVAAVAATGAIASAAAMALFFHPGGDPSAVYFNSFTHAEGLLLGCGLAAAVPPWRMTATVAPNARRLLERSGVAALAAVLVGLVALGFRSALTYRGGMLAVDAATVVVVATVAHPASRLGAVLSRQPLRWLGLRSYSLYLWHWPIFEMTRPGVDIHAPGWLVLLLRLVLTASAAELSYRYVEQPWRNGRAVFAIRVRLAAASRQAVVAAVALPVALMSVVLATAPGPDEPAILAEGSTVAARHLPAAPVLATDPAGASAPAASAVGLPVDTGTPKPWIRSHPPVTAPPPPPAPAPSPAASEPILAIGDSVLLAASPALSAALGPQITIDAQVGRQVNVGLERLAAYRASGALTRYRTVLIDLGTNGAFRPQEFQQLVQLVAGIPRVVLYDVHADRPWAPESNSTITTGVQAHPTQMEMVDWNQAASAPNLLYSDGIHPNGAGAQVYTQLLNSALTANP